jgi:CMP-N,N'-diacetyllegionaminic acid synthase
MKILKKKIICFDIDGVICTTYGLNYKKSKSIKKNISKINFLYETGFYVKLYTARFMGRSNENRFLAKRKAEKITVSQLKKWKVNYHELIFGKPTYDLFVDDKNLFHKKNWSKYIDKTIKLLK